MSICLSELTAIRLFAGLTDGVLERIASRLEECIFLSGAVILTRQAPADALFFILSGKVRVELRDSAGQIFNLAELGSGEVVGERAILTGEPRSADVRALCETRAARLSRPDFLELLSHTPQLYANLCQDLARQLGSWAQRHQREEHEHRDVITSVIGWQLLPEFGAFPGSSPWVKELNRRLEILGGSPANILITGEAGTWKDLAARLVHFHGAPGRPVLFLDCATPPPLLQGETVQGDLGNRLLLEMSQEAALFGFAPEGALSVRRTRRGMLELAAGGDLILRNVDCLTPGAQASLCSYLESGRFRRQGESELRGSRVRIIATSGESLTEPGNFSVALYERVAMETISMVPLRERKKDIPVMARSLLKSLNAKHHKEVRRISQDALNRLVDHDWPLNGSELYQVLSRAVVVCSDEEIHPEQIFLQGDPFGDGRFRPLGPDLLPPGRQHQVAISHAVVGIAGEEHQARRGAEKICGHRQRPAPQQHPAHADQNPQLPGVALDVVTKQSQPPFAAHVRGGAPAEPQPRHPADLVGRLKGGITHASRWDLPPARGKFEPAYSGRF